MGSIAGAIAGLFDGCVTAYAGEVGADGSAVQVCYTEPGTYLAATIVAVATQVRTPITRPTMGSNRSRDTAAEIDLTVSVYVPGGDEAQVAAYAESARLQRLLEDWLRVGTNGYLAGSCRDTAWVSNSVLQPVVVTDEPEDPSTPPTVIGRMVNATLTVTAPIRY